MKIRYEGLVDFSGYGTVTRNMAKWLGKIAEVHIVPYGQVVIADGLEKLFGNNFNPDVIVSHCIPAHKKYQVLQTIYECMPCAPEWKYPLDNADLIITMSKHSKECLETVTDNKVVIVPNGIDPDFGTKPIGNGFPTDKYRFLSVFEWVPRKQGELLLRAFCEAFKPEDKVELWIKSRHCIGNPLADIPKVLRNYPGMKDKVMYINSHFDDMANLYQLFDSFVCPSALEGFGLTFLEAMCCGLKPIGPSIGGTEDFMNDSNSYRCEMSDWEPVVHFGQGLFAPNAMWKHPTKESLIEKLRLAYEKKDFLTESQRAALRKKWSWENAAKTMLKELEMFQK